MGTLSLLAPEALSLDALKKVIVPIRNSSNETYESHFNSFVNFIKKRNGKNCFQFSEVVEYFNFLANKGFRSSTLKGIRTALREPLKLYFPNVDILSDPCIKNIIQFVKSHSKRADGRFPSWDLNLVVRMLKLRRDNDLLFWLKKVLFITFLACPFRIGEFQAISLAESVFSPLHIRLKTHIGHLSKNETDSFSPNPIIIPAFSEDPELCPVKLINAYVEWSSSWCREKGIPRPDRFWINLKGKPLSINVMRSWVKDIIFLGDPNAAKGTKVHSIRGQVASHLFARGLSVKQVMMAMNWKEKSTFKNFYARLGIKTLVRAVLAGQS